MQARMSLQPGAANGDTVQTVYLSFSARAIQVNIPLAAVVSLLHEAASGTLATQFAALPGYPYASAMPYVLDEHHRPVICVSALAEHTKNLRADSRVSFSVLQPGVSDLQNGPRLTLIADAERFQASPAFRARYLRYEPGAESLLTLDFMFFRLRPLRLRYIGGFARMGWVADSDWAALPAHPLEEEEALLREFAERVPMGVRVLGVDCLGIDYEISGLRRRLGFPDAPVAGARLREIGARALQALA